MASDRFVDFDHVRPTHAQVGWLIADYLGGAAQSVELQDGATRWVALLHGKKSVALRRILPEHPWALCAEELSKEERWIEVFMDENQLDVITRHADEYTDGVADDLARLIARFWDGRVRRG